MRGIGNVADENRVRGKCLNFVAGSNTCKVVEGKVSPDGWCMFWVKAG